jgi:hypothetical protein
MSQYAALITGSIGLGVTSIAYFISSHERYRINKLRSCRKVDIIEIKPKSSEDSGTEEYLIRGTVDTSVPISLEECPESVRKEHEAVYKKVTVVDTLFECKILQEQKKKSTVICSEYSSFARVMRNKSKDIRIKQEDNFWSQSLYIENISAASLDEFGLQEIYRKYEPVGDLAATQALRMQHRALVLNMAQAKNSDGVSSYVKPVVLGTDVKVEALCKNDEAYVFGGSYYLQRPDDEHLTCSNPYLMTLNKNVKQVVQELKGTIATAENIKWFFGIPSIMLVGYGSGIADKFSDTGSI